MLKTYDENVILRNIFYTLLFTKLLQKVQLSNSKMYIFILFLKRGKISEGSGYMFSCKIFFIDYLMENEFLSLSARTQLKWKIIKL